MFRRLGYFVTESSEHFAEYVPWFIKRDRPDLIERFGIPLDEYPARCEIQLAGWEDLRARMEDPDCDPRRGAERRVRLGHHPLDRDRPAARRVRQRDELGLISNLPDECCVEVPCLVDHNGVQPTPIGRIPPQLAALMQTNINVQSLTVEAILTGNREHVYHAAMFDPHTAAELDLDQIWQLVDDLIDAHGDYIPEPLRSHRNQPKQGELTWPRSCSTTSTRSTTTASTPSTTSSLDIADSEFLVLVGPSGCGKSTALRMVAGLETITGGEMRIGDRVVNDVEPKDRDIAMVFQNYALYPHMTVYDNIGFALKLAKVPKDEIDEPGAQGGGDRSSSSRTSTASRASCRAASASGWRWAGRSCASRRRS